MCAKTAGGTSGCADDIVLCADQLLAVETTDLHECVIAVADATVQVGDGDQALLVRETTFLLGDGLVVAHGEHPSV